MGNPFPGMNPFLEAPSLWPDVHHRLIAEFCVQIQRQLNPAYVAVITPYTLFESLEIAPRRVAMIPDVGVLQPEPSRGGGGGVAVAPTPTAPTLTMPAEMQIPTRYARLEIRSVEGETLVTAVELLSPANKRLGLGEGARGQGAAAYNRKRQELFQTSAHLLEIDLLRNGIRPRLIHPLPEAAYFVFLSRAEHRPDVDVWPVQLRDPLPVVPVPLRRPDPDVALDINAALAQIHESAAYERRIDYRSDPPPPTLSEEDAKWLDSYLRKNNLRD
jgi:hypothetical protein